MHAGRQLRNLLAGGAGLARDVVAAARTLREVERARWVEGPAALVARLRARGVKSEARSPAARERLFRVIHHVDRLMRGGPNCYRRSLALVALDAEAAREPFVLGLNRTGDGPRGHAWVADPEKRYERFDVEFRL